MSDINDLIKNKKYDYKRLMLFGEIINHVFGISMWCTDDNCNLIYTQEEEKELFWHFFVIGGCKRYIDERKGKINRPLYLMDALGMTWVAENVYEEETPRLVVLMGPLFQSTLSEHEIEQKLRKMNISVKLKIRMRKLISQIPIITLSSLNQYAQMMHFIIIDEPIRSGEIEIQHVEIVSEKDDSAERKKDEINAEHIVRYEKILMKAISDGNPGFKTAMDKYIQLAGTVTVTEDNIRDIKNSVLVLCAKCANAAIEGGGLIEFVKKIESSYMNKVERCEEKLELMLLQKIMIEEFYECVRKEKNRLDIPTDIRKACDYIRSHLSEALTTEEIAKYVGYTEYYFTKKFKKYMGMRLNDFIKKEKIEQAKFDLRYTDNSIEEISEELCFKNRNYFNKIFRELTGETPSEYRNLIKEKITPKK